MANVERDVEALKRADPTFDQYAPPTSLREVRRVESAARTLQTSEGGRGVYAHHVVRTVKLVELNGIAPVVYSDAAKVRLRAISPTTLLTHALVSSTCCSSPQRTAATPRDRSQEGPGCGEGPVPGP